MKRISLITALLLTPLASLQAADEGAAPAYEQLLKIDVHSHVFEDFPALNDLFQRINMRTVNICVPAGDGHIEQMHRAANELQRKYPWGVNICRQRLAGNVPEFYMLFPSGTKFKDPKAMGNLVMRR